MNRQCLFVSVLAISLIITMKLGPMAVVASSYPAAPLLTARAAPQFDTYVGGAITQATTWDLIGSPYIVTSDVTVQNGAILTVNPGVEVRFNNNTGLYVHGTLRATGTSIEPITFTTVATTPAPGQWKGLFFEPDSDDASNLLEYVTVSYAGQWNYWYYGNGSAGIGIYDASPIIRNTTVRHTSGSGLWAGSTSLTLSHDTFEQNGDKGVLAVNSNLTLSDSTVQNNGNTGCQMPPGCLPPVVRLRNWRLYQSLAPEPG